MEKKKTNIGYLEAFLSIFVNILLFILKYYVGISTNSIAIIADAWHTLSDSFSSIILFFGFNISKKPPDEEHPFGHGRIEIIFSVIIGTILAVIGFNFLLESFHRFREQTAADFTTFSIIVIIISLISKEVLARFAFWGARKTGSHLLSADGWHHRSDAFTSLVILVGIIAGRRVWWIDSVLGFILSLTIFYASFDILRRSISSLIGEKPDDKILEQLQRIIGNTVDRKLNFHHFHYHCYGSHKEISFHIVLPGEMKLSAAHEISDRIEKEIKKEMDMDATIHIEPKKEER